MPAVKSVSCPTFRQWRDLASRAGQNDDVFSAQLLADATTAGRSVFDRHISKPISAQRQSATPESTVQDSSGAVVGGARSRFWIRKLIRFERHRPTRSAPSDSRISDLPIGSYEVRVEGRGFAPYTNAGVTLAIGQTARLLVVSSDPQVFRHQPHGKVDLVVEAFNFVDRTNVSRIYSVLRYLRAPLSPFGRPIEAGAVCQIQFSIEFEF